MHGDCDTIQEKIIEGDFEYTVGTKHRKARQIKNFKQDNKRRVDNGDNSLDPREEAFVEEDYEDD